jgi:peptidoglycan-associated lipoprotein
MRLKTVLTTTAIALFLSACGGSSVAPSKIVNDSQAADATVPKSQNESPAQPEQELNRLEQEKLAGGDVREQAADPKALTVFFDFDSHAISEEMKPRIAEAAAWIKAGRDFDAVKVEGNCDEFGSDEYNLALGLKRAKSVKEALVGHGVNAEKIKLITYGKANPACSDSTPECWKENRRVDFQTR